MQLMSRPCMALVHVPRPPDPLAWVERAWDISLHLWHCWAAWPDDCNSLEYCGGEESGGVLALGSCVVFWRGPAVLEGEQP